MVDATAGITSADQLDPDRQDDEEHQRPDDRKKYQCRGNAHGAASFRSDLFKFDETAVEILGMQEENRLAMRPDLRLPRAQRAARISSTS